VTFLIPKVFSIAGGGDRGVLNGNGLGGQKPRPAGPMFYNAPFCKTEL